MAISDKRLDDFIERYEKVYGERITRDEARPIATRLVTIYRVITKPLPSEFNEAAERNPERTDSGAI